MPLRVGIPQQPYTFFVEKLGNRYVAQERKGRTRFSSDEVGAVINECIDDMTKGGKILLGNFPRIDPAMLETTIKFPEGNQPIHLAGFGYNKTMIKLADGKNVNMVDITPTSSVYMPAISNLTLHGHKTNITIGIGLYLNDKDGGVIYDFHLRQVVIEECVEDGAQMDNFWGYRIVNCIIERNGGNGIYVSAGTSGHIALTRFGANGNHGLLFSGRNTTILSCEFETSQKQGLYLVNVENEVIGGYVRNNSQIGVGSQAGCVLGAAADRTRIIGVTFEGNNQELYGLYLVAGATDCRIDQCMFANHVKQAIYDDGTRTRINGLGRGAYGVGGTPTAGEWDIGDLVRNTDDNTLWIKCADGVMRKLA